MFVAFAQPPLSFRHSLFVGVLPPRFAKIQQASAHQTVDLFAVAHRRCVVVESIKV